jgi:hypothetical protein
MRSDEGIQLHLFDMDKYGDTMDDNLIILQAETKTHMEFTSISDGNTDTKFCIAELGGYGGMKKHKWLVIKINNRENSEPKIFDSMTEAMSHVETLTGKIVKFRRGS